MIAHDLLEVPRREDYSHGVKADADARRERVSVLAGALPSFGREKEMSLGCCTGKRTYVLRALAVRVPLGACDGSQPLPLQPNDTRVSSVVRSRDDAPTADRRFAFGTKSNRLFLTKRGLETASGAVVRADSVLRSVYASSVALAAYDQEIAGRKADDPASMLRAFRAAQAALAAEGLKVELPRSLSGPPTG